MHARKFGWRGICRWLTGLGLAASAISGMAAGIPVYDANANLMAKSLQELTQRMGQDVLAQDAIKRHLADGVLRDYLGRQLLQPMLGQLSIQAHPAQAQAVTGMMQHVNQQPGQWGGQAFGQMPTTSRDVLAGRHDFTRDVAAFYGAEGAANCPANASPDLLSQCQSARNILASQLQEIQAIAAELDARNNALRRMLQDHSYSTLAELQQKQYMMSTLQAIIANDNLRLQASLAAYQGMRQLYQEKYQTAVQQRVTGKAGTLLGRLTGNAMTAAAIKAGRLAAGGTHGRLFELQRPTP